MATIGESFEFVKEHPKAIAGVGVTVLALVVASDMAGDYEAGVVDPLQDKYTCVVDYLEVTQQDPGSEVVVDVAPQPVPDEGAEVNCESALEDLLKHDYEDKAEDAATLATVGGRPQLVESTTSDLTWTEIETEVGERLEAAQDGKTGHVARKFGGFALGFAVIVSAVGGAIIGGKAAVRNTAESFALSRRPRIKTELERSETERPVARSASTIEDANDLSDVEVPMNISDELSEDPASTAQSYARLIAGGPVGEGKQHGKAEADEAEQETRRLAAQLAAKRMENEAISGNPSLPEPVGLFGRLRGKS